MDIQKELIEEDEYGIYPLMSPLLLSYLFTNPLFAIVKISPAISAVENPLPRYNNK